MSIKKVKEFMIDPNFTDKVNNHTEQLINIQSELNEHTNDITEVVSALELTRQDVDELMDYKTSALVTKYPLTLINGVQIFNPNFPPFYRKTGKFVEIIAHVTGITAPNTTIANIPNGFRPPVEMYSVHVTSTTNTGARFARWKLTTSGNIILETTMDKLYDVSSNTFWYVQFNYSIEEVSFG